MKSKRFLALCLFLVLVIVTTTGCGGGGGDSSTQSEGTGETASDASGGEKDTITIGAAIQGNQSTFLQYVVSGMYKYLEEEAPDVEMTVVFADDDATKQTSQMESFIAQKVDVILLNPVDKVVSAVGADMAYEAGIPVLTVNAGCDAKNLVAHVGSDDVESGRLQMQRLIDVVGPNGKIAYANATLGHNTQIAREQGYLQAIEANPGVEVVATGVGDWSTDLHMKLVENWIQSGVEMDAIATMCDTSALGALAALENAGLAGKIKLGGMDCMGEILAAIEAGTVDNSVWQDGVGQGYHAVRLAIDVANGKEVEDYDIPYEICTKENLDIYLAKHAEREELSKKYF